MNVAVITNSTTARYALPRGYSPSFVVNAIAARCRRDFPSIRLDTYHIAGSSNAVDPLSRNQPPPYEDCVSGLRRMMGQVQGLNAVPWGEHEAESGGNGASRTKGNGSRLTTA